MYLNIYLCWVWSQRERMLGTYRRALTLVFLLTTIALISATQPDNWPWMAPNDSKMAPELLTELNPAEQRRNKQHNRCAFVWMEFSLCKLTRCQNLSCCPLAWCAWIRKQRKLTESESTNSEPLFAANSQLHHQYGHTCKKAATQEHAERQRAAVDRWQSPSSPPSIPLFIYTCWLMGSGCLWVVLGEMGGVGGGGYSRDTAKLIDLEMRG